MKIAVMGAGALGCYFGGRLAAAGEEVAFIARGPHLEALRRQGLRIESPLGDLTLERVTATDDPAEVGPVDLVLFLVKLQDTRSAAAAIGPLLGPETAVLSFQNGIDAWTWIGEAVGPERVVGGTAAIPADVRAPGVVRHSAPFARLTIGEFDGRESPRCLALAAALEAAGVEVALVPDIEVKIWQKFVMLTAFSAVTALTRLPIGPIRATPETRELFRRAVAETLAVGRIVCPGLPESTLDAVMAFVEAAPPGIQSSMLDDLLRGKPLELEHLSGAVVRVAAENRMAAPTHDLVVRALAPYAKGPPALP